MKLSDYIESGILEEFCAGVLDAEQERKVLALARKYPPIREEIDRIEEALYQFDHENSIQPSGRLRDQLLQQINKIQSGNPEKEALPEKVVADQTTTSVVNRRIRMWQYATAAAVTAFLISTVLSIYFSSQWKQVRTENASLKSDLLKSEEQFALLQNQYLDYNNITQGREYKPIDLEGIGDHQDSYAKIFRGENFIFISTKNLPPPPNDKQYQFWAIVDGVPTSIGLIDREATGEVLSKLDNIKNASAFAISLEDLGGKESPTAEQIHVLGKVI